MKDEIKEILESSRKIIKSNRENGFDRIIMLGDDIDKLLDYITNLQTIEQQYSAILSENAELENKITNLQERFDALLEAHKIADELETEYQERNEKANTLLDEMLERAYIDGEYIMYDYSTSELLEVKQALQGEDKE